MSQHDFNIANQGFPATRADINNALTALASNSSGTTAPSTTYANQFWYDTTNNLLMMRNEADSAWITLAYLNQASSEWEVRTAVVQAVDAGGISLKTDDGTTRVEIEDNGDVSFNTDTLHVDATNSRVGIGNASPGFPLDVRKDGGGSAVTARIYNSGTTLTDDAVLRLGIAGTTGETAIYFGDGANSFIGQLVYDHANNRMEFFTNGSERVRIDNAGVTMFGTTNNTPATNNVEGHAIGATAEFSRSGSNPVDVNRGVDGALVIFRGQGTSEGSISVSGTTVSYNGGHLSRWSQPASGARIEGLLKGTVMTNLDQMAVWGDEENEQLNCMAVSSVEGDPNVAGVFVNWDDDDDVYTFDMNVGMTGDFIIRIAQGVTVQRGDLLMSAGDGTAKPQGDDIIRSKTVAKVTSTHVTCTYDDGSYCVPCVIMAC